MFYRWIVRPVLYMLAPETAHHLVMGLLRLASHTPGAPWLLRLLYGSVDHRLRVRALGLDFTSPVGLAAGLDKDAEAHRALGALGFGFVEVGTLTALPQPGNPKPRLFRLPKDAALINRMGFNNRGAADAARRLAADSRRSTVLGVNVGKSKATPAEDALSDYQQSVRLLAPEADYLVVNVSSPNTPGLRDLQAVAQLEPLLRGVDEVLRAGGGRRSRPLLVKIAPDLADEDVDAVAALALRLELDGIIATNTTIGREGLVSDPTAVERCGAGGLSGGPLSARSLEVLRRLRAAVGDRVGLVAVGGIVTPEDAWERIRAGASLVQVYTALIYQGPALVRRLNRGLAQRVSAAGLSGIQDAIGADTDRNP